MRLKITKKQQQTGIWFYMKQTAKGKKKKKGKKSMQCNWKQIQRAASPGLNSASTLLELELKLCRSYKQKIGNKMSFTFTDTQTQRHREYMICIISRPLKTICKELHFLLVPTRGLPLTSDSCNCRNMIIVILEYTTSLIKKRYTII